MRIKLPLQERIARATKIREDKKKHTEEITSKYINSVSFKLKKIVTICYSIYISLSLIPYYPTFFGTQEIVAFNDYDRSTRVGPIIFCDTDKKNEYEIKGSVMGSHAFHRGDTIISQKNIVYKTKAIYHKKYDLSYPIDKQLSLLILFASFTVVLIIMVLSKDSRMEKTHDIVTLIALIFFLIYLST